MKPNETVLKFIELRAAGRSYRAIAKELNVAVCTLVEWAKETSTNEAIEQQIKLRRDTLYEEIAISEEAKVRRLAGILNRIDKAIEGIDLTLIPPHKLLELRIKYAEELSACVYNTDPKPVTWFDKMVAKCSQDD